MDLITALFSAVLGLPLLKTHTAEVVIVHPSVSRLNSESCEMNFILLRIGPL